MMEQLHDLKTTSVCRPVQRKTSERNGKVMLKATMRNIPSYSVCRCVTRATKPAYYDWLDIDYFSFGASYENKTFGRKPKAFKPQRNRMLLASSACCEKCRHQLAKCFPYMPIICMFKCSISLQMNGGVLWRGMACPLYDIYLIYVVCPYLIREEG